jgi:hypothetical protein
MLFGEALFLQDTGHTVTDLICVGNANFVCFTISRTLSERIPLAECIEPRVTTLKGLWQSKRLLTVLPHQVLPYLLS